MLKIGKIVMGSVQTNCYFVYKEGEKKIIVIDPADRGEYSEVVPSLRTVLFPSYDSIASSADKYHGFFVLLRQRKEHAAIFFRQQVFRNANMC